jgi:hypothetical protein
MKMADTASIAATRRDALTRLEQSMRLLGGELGVAPIRLTHFNRDPAWLQARQLSEMADYLESVVKALHPIEDVKTAEVPIENAPAAEPTNAPVADSRYTDMTRKELEALADARQVTVTGTGANGNVLVSDLRAALEAADAQAEQA